jgi:ribosomal protein L7Ae-like RNA K-turn-binding protein
MNDRLLNMLGLAMRAGGVVTGDEACMARVRSGKALLTLVAQDAGPNTKKKYRDKCRSYNVPLIEVGSKAELGRALGKIERAVAVIVNKGFAERILQLSREQIGGEACE